VSIRTFTRESIFLRSSPPIAAVVMLEAVPAAAESTWDQIKRTGQLRYGAIDYARAPVRISAPKA